MPEDGNNPNGGSLPETLRQLNLLPEVNNQTKTLRQQLADIRTAVDSLINQLDKAEAAATEQNSGGDERQASGHKPNGGSDSSKPAIKPLSTSDMAEFLDGPLHNKRRSEVNHPPASPGGSQAPSETAAIPRMQHAQAPMPPSSPPIQQVQVNSYYQPAPFQHQQPPIPQQQQHLYDQQSRINQQYGTPPQPMYYPQHPPQNNYQRPSYTPQPEGLQSGSLPPPQQQQPYYQQQQQQPPAQPSLSNQNSAGSLPPLPHSLTQSLAQPITGQPPQQYPNQHQLK
jgi:hypothetical protein